MLLKAFFGEMKKRNLVTNRFLNIAYYIQLIFLFLVKLFFVFCFLFFLFLVFGFELTFEFFPDVLVNNFDTVYQGGLGLTFFYGLKGYIYRMNTFSDYFVVKPYKKWKYRSFTRKIQLLKSNELNNPIIMKTVKSEDNLEPLVLPEFLDVMPDVQGTSYLLNRKRHLEYLLRDKNATILFNYMESYLRPQMLVGSQNLWRKYYLENLFEIDERYKNKHLILFYANHQDKYKFIESPYIFGLPVIDEPVTVPKGFYTFYRKFFVFKGEDWVSRLVKTKYYRKYFSSIFNAIKHNVVDDKRKPPFYFNGVYTINQKSSNSALRYKGQDDFIDSPEKEEITEHAQFGLESHEHDDIAFNWIHTNARMQDYNDNINFGEYHLNITNPFEKTDTFIEALMKKYYYLNYIVRKLNLPIISHRKEPFDEYMVGVPYVKQVFKSASMENDKFFYYKDMGYYLSNSQYRFAFWKPFYYRTVFRYKDHIIDVLDRSDFHLAFLRLYRTLFNIPKIEYINFFFTYFFRTIFFSFDKLILENMFDFFGNLELRLKSSYFGSLVFNLFSQVYSYFFTNYAMDSYSPNYTSIYFFNLNDKLLSVLRFLFIFLLIYFIVYKFFYKGKLFSLRSRGILFFLVIFISLLILSRYANRRMWNTYNRQYTEK
jgi:hypothetical protein